jgi:C-terminal processing protease CtpA/Prc
LAIAQAKAQLSQVKVIFLDLRENGGGAIADEPLTA